MRTFPLLVNRRSKMRKHRVKDIIKTWAFTSCKLSGDKHTKVALESAMAARREEWSHRSPKLLLVDQAFIHVTKHTLVNQFFPHARKHIVALPLHRLKAQNNGGICGTLNGPLMVRLVQT